MSEPEKKTKLSTSRKITFYGISLLFILLIFEVVIRICYPLPELQNFNRINYQILDPIAEGGPGYLRNITMTWRSSPDTSAIFEHRFNTYGFRDEEWSIEKPSGKKRILFVGDSFTEGMMASQDQTIPEGFKKAAGKYAKDYELMNAGMMGIGLNEYLKFIGDAVPIFQPDVVLMVLYSNDIPFQREYQPAEILKPKKHSFFTPRLAVVLDHIQKKDPIPFRWNRPVVPFHKAVPDPSNPWTTQETQLKPQVSPPLAEAMKKGELNFFRTNWILEEEKFLKSQPDIFPKLTFLNNYLKKYGTELAIFYIPSRSQVTDYYYQYDKQSCLTQCPEQLSLTGDTYQLHQKVLAGQCQVLGIPFYDLTDIVKSEEAQGNHLYWNYDDHMRGSSYMMLGEKVYNRWAGK